MVTFLLGLPAALAAQGRPALYARALPGEETPPPVPREFRGVWIATVGNIDWPSRPGLPVDSQKAELIALLDRAAALRLNAVIFQVRPAADAFYKSPHEPWSYYLTGTMGTAPDPAWDPLAFAVRESHRRGMELHAWFNPYRARYRGQRGRAARTHVSNTMPGVVKRYGPYEWMDPGSAAVRAHTIKVITDVVTRYDIDGVHIDDYFYPYPERDRRGRVIDFPDDETYRRYVRGGGTLSREDWRRQNVDLLVEALHREIKKTKPWVKFGISPFGIWRPGYPEVVRGLDAYEVLFADSKRWLNEGWLDYFTPQLYWAESASGQRYSTLLEWWAQQNTRGRHLWPGNADYKVTDQARNGNGNGNGHDVATGNTQWPAGEIIRQISITRDVPGAAGNVHYNMTALMQGPDALHDRLASGPYALPALVPASPWLLPGRPAPPQVTRTVTDEGVVLRIEAPGARGPLAARWWLVRAKYDDGWRALVAEATQPTVVLPFKGDGLPPDVVAVNVIDLAGVESPTRLVP
ncbi:MAG TPA: family 10 glycosylhydrolase [Gemmatimonadaceae bacterium]